MNLSPRLEDWVDHLAQNHRYRVDLTLTSNRSTMISIRQKSRRHAVIRMQKTFEQAPDSVLQSLTAYLITKNISHWKCVASFAKSIPAGTPKTAHPLRTEKGKHFDLDRELSYVKETYFAKPPEASIAWGKAGKPRRRKRRSIRFGSWHADCKQVRIHPLLDQEWVPREFMHYLIYHELCHAAEPPFSDSAGRHHIHHSAFKALERRFPNYSGMEGLSKAIFMRLIKERC